MYIGRGSYLTQGGMVEMDASIMDGSTRRGGGVACIANVAHAVHVARLVMDKVCLTIAVTSANMQS